MISDVSLAVNAAIVPCETSAALVNWGGEAVGIVQPLRNVRHYLNTRKPQPHWKGEEALLATLFPSVRTETKALLQACELVNKLSTGKGRVSVSAACTVALRTFKEWHWNAKTFRAKYDEWSIKKDWTALVNKAKAPAAWRDAGSTLTESFLVFCEKRMGQFKRDDAKREAWRSIHRHWRSGKDEDDNECPIPGYEKNWDKRNREIVPPGWSYSNIMQQLKARGKFTKAVQVLLQEGISSARASLPQVHGTRASLRFLEKVQFDDVKTDFRVFDPETGEVMDLWLLIAHDVATGVLLGFGMRPARAREDGSQEHLTLKDMKQLCGWLLERYGLPPYTMHWVFECGTATITEGTSRALEEFLGDRIQVHFTQMVGGDSPVGYKETSKGNSGSKGSLESGNRLIHIIGSRLPGQTGRNYGKRPADLAAREKECKQIWQLAQELPTGLRGQAEYPLLTLQQAREHIRRIARIRNSRTDHNLEGFERIVVWYNPADGQWHPQQTAPHPLPEGARVEQRMESPDQRAFRLVLPFRNQWSGVSPEIIVAFYERKAEPVMVNDAGEIKFRHEGNDLYFRPPSAALGLPPKTKGIGYHHPDDPSLLHVTNGKGVILGTWLRRHLVNDEAALSEALRYTASALNAAKDYAAQLATADAQKLEAMRQHNAELLQFRTFTDIAPADQIRTSEVSSPVAHALTTGVRKAKQSAKAAAEQEAEDARIAREALGNIHG